MVIFINEALTSLDVWSQIQYENMDIFQYISSVKLTLQVQGVLIELSGTEIHSLPNC